MSFGNFVFFDEYMKAVSKDPENPRAGLHIMFAEYLLKKRKEAFEKNREIFWITINPKPEVEFEEFKKMIMEKLVTRIFMKDATYVFEQRAKKAPYSGVHCHIMVDKIMSPKQMFDRLFSTIKNYVGNKKHLDLRVYPYTMREDKLDYLKGLKWDSDKDECIEATKQWRQENNIDDIYKA